MNRLYTSKRILYDIDGQVICSGKSRFGGTLKMNGNQDACELLQLAYRPNDDVIQNYNRRKMTLRQYYEGFFEDASVPETLVKYKDTNANLILHDDIGFIEVKGGVFILLPAGLRRKIRFIINSSKKAYSKKVTRVREKMNNAVRPFTVVTRVGASIVNP